MLGQDRRLPGALNAMAVLVLAVLGAGLGLAFGLFIGMGTGLIGIC